MEFQLFESICSLRSFLYHFLDNGRMVWLHYIHCAGATSRNNVQNLLSTSRHNNVLSNDHGTNSNPTTMWQQDGKHIIAFVTCKRRTVVCVCAVEWIIECCCRFRINLLVAGIVRQKFITLKRQSECAVDIRVILASSVARRISHTKQHPNRNYFRWHFAQKVAHLFGRSFGWLGCGVWLG